MSGARSRARVPLPVLVAGLALALVGCGTTDGETQGGRRTDGSTSRPSCTHRTGFELSLASDRGGQPSPVKAATWFAAHGGVQGIPLGGWLVVGRNRDGTTLRSGSTTLHAVQGSDATWQVDAGSRCT